MRARCLLVLCTVATTLMVTGCGGGATVSEGQCVAGDWQTVGYRDGAGGLRSTRLLEHQDACARHQIIPDRNGYMIGWNAGIEEYCRPTNGFAEGERGARYDNVCPTDLEAAFLDSYRQGRALYTARREVQALTSQLARMEARVDTLKAEIVSSGAAQLSPDLTPARRIELLAETQRLTEEKAATEAEIPAIAQELAYKEQELDRLQQSLATIAY